MKNVLQFKTGAKILIFLLSFSFFTTVNAQEYSLGIKAGLNYSLNNRGSEIVDGSGSFTANSQFGYGGGVFAEVDFNKFFIRPEIIYNHTNGEFPFAPNPSEYIVNKLSVPLLVGYTIYGPLDLYAGPAYQFLIERSLENTISSLDQEYSNLALQYGAKMVLNRFELDLRYDFTFSSKHNEIINIPGSISNAYFDDGRLNQVIFSVNYKLFGSKIEPVRKGGSCYF
tara:strand:- start:29 stop:706 length:678 start_codon:yes stop_codon:yes gene_type:complete